MPITSPNDIAGLRAWLDCRDAVWSGSNLSSLANAGADGGSCSLVGTPVKGVQLHGFDTIRLSSDAMRLDLALSAWTSGHLSFFWYGQVITGGSITGRAIFGAGWPNSGGSEAVACYIGNSASNSFNAGDGCCAIEAAQAPIYRSDANITDATPVPHSIGGRFGTTVASYLDGAAATILESATAVAPDYNARTWRFGEAGDTGESIAADTFVWLVYDTALTAQNFQDLHDYFTNLGAGISGTAAITEANDTVASTATLAIEGQAALTEADDTVAATGELPISGVSAITEADDAVTSTGASALTGSAAIVEADDVISATGTVSGAQPVPTPAPSFGGGFSAGYTRPFTFTPEKKKQLKKQRKKQRKIIKAELAEMMRILAPHEMPTAPVRNGSILNPQLARQQIKLVPQVDEDEEEEEIATLLLAA